MQFSFGTNKLGGSFEFLLGENWLQMIGLTQGFDTEHYSAWGNNEWPFVISFSSSFCVWAFVLLYKGVVNLVNQDSKFHMVCLASE